MDLLEGAAAFAVVMIVFSTIVTGIVEGLMRLTATRQSVLARAVESLMRREIAPRFREALLTRYGVASGKDAYEIVARRFADQMTLNPLAELTDDEKQDWRAVKRRSVVRRLRQHWNDGVETLTTYSFLQRVAKTEVGQELEQLARSELRETLTDLSRTYERYVAASNELFRRYAHVTTTLIAGIFALTLNIDASRVFTHLMDSPDTRASLIAYGEEAAQENRDAVAELNQLIAQLEMRKRQAGDGAASAEVGFSDVQEVEEKIDELSVALAPLIETHQIPMGWSYYPFCGSPRLSAAAAWVSGLFGAAAEGEADDAEPCSDAEAAKDRTLLGWAANVLIAGILISLGGPFWYRVYSGLSRIAAVANTVRGGRSDTIEKNAAGQTASQAALTDEDILKTFETARRGAPPPEEKPGAA